MLNGSLMSLFHFESPVRENSINGCWLKTPPTFEKNGQYCEKRCVLKNLRSFKTGEFNRFALKLTKQCIEYDLSVWVYSRRYMLSICVCIKAFLLRFVSILFNRSRPITTQQQKGAQQNQEHNINREKKLYALWALYVCFVWDIVPEEDEQKKRGRKEKANVDNLKNYYDFLFDMRTPTPPPPSLGEKEESH